MLALQWRKWRKIFPSLALGLFLATTACAPEPPSRYEQVQQETSQRNAPPAVAKEATQGSNFNKFFPKSGGGFEVAAAQEKKGFAEYKINRGGKNVAMLSISDTTGVAGAADKFQSSNRTIAGYPAVDQGQNITAILVNGRYQVKVQSRDPSFTKADREAWISKFNLGGLASLQ